MSRLFRSARPSPYLIPARAAERAATNYTTDPETGCRVSNYSVNSVGYAQIGWQIAKGVAKKAGTTAHRAAWTHAHGPIPPGMTIDHLCKNRRCVNVDHLRMLTNFENARRTAGRDWPLGQCVNGHPNSELRVDGVKRAYCAPCKREHGRRYNEKKGRARTGQ